MSDVVMAALLVLSFALWVTLHGVLAFGLIRRSERGFWLLLLVLPPTFLLAPYWGFKAGLKGRSAIWLLLLLLYLSLLVMGRSFDG